MLEDAQQKGYVLQTADVAQTDFGVAIYFDYLEDETLTTEASITDNYVESNYSIQDHIAIKPKIYRLRGCVGEIVYRNNYFEWMNKITNKINHPVLLQTLDKMKPIVSVSPIISNYTQLAKNIVDQIESSFDRYKKMWNDYKGMGNPYKGNRQKMVVAILNQILQQRLPVRLEDLKYTYEPFSEGQYNKLYFLQSVSAHQGDNNFITDVEVTIKEFRIATTKVTKLDKNKYGAPTVSEVQKTTTQLEGTAKGQPTKKPSDIPIFNQLPKATKYMAEGKTWQARLCQKICNHFTSPQLKGIQLMSLVSGIGKK